MTKIEISERLEASLAILEKFIIDCDHQGINSNRVTDAIRMLRTIPVVEEKEEYDENKGY